ncbi:MAG: YbjQ family protein [Bacteroidota bacterium]
MILTTTSGIDGVAIRDYLGLVTGETIIGSNVFSDFFASITDIVGGRSSSYESVLKEAKDVAIEEMTNKAEALGADAIIGIDIDYETIGKGMLMVIATGTAVRR